MGINNLLNTLKIISQKTHLKFFEGKNIGIVKKILLKKGWTLLDSQVFVYKYL